MHYLPTLASLFATFSAVVSAVNCPNNTPLNHCAMIMTHNSATGEDNDSRFGSNGQIVKMDEQLDCGTRAFDYRPYYDGSSVTAHHGSALVNVLMSVSIGRVISWLNRPENSEELVILYVSHFDGDTGYEAAAPGAAETVLLSLGLNSDQIIRENECTADNTSPLYGMTVGSAKTLGQVSGGGSMLAIFQCTNEQYDSNIMYGSATLSDFYGYMSSKSYIPDFDTMTYGRMWMVQAHWQWSFGNGTPIGNEIDSDLNLKVAAKIAGGSYGFLNFVEVNNSDDMFTFLHI